MRIVRSKLLRSSVALSLACAAGGALPAASLAGPVLSMVKPAEPDSVLPGQVIALEFAIQNTADEAGYLAGASTSSPVVLADTVGPGLSVARYAGTEVSTRTIPAGSTECSTSGSTLTCSYGGTLIPGALLHIRVEMTVEPDASGVVSNSVSVSGGGAPSIGSEQHMTVGPAEPFAFTLGEARFRGADGLTATRAASDPIDFTTTLRFAKKMDSLAEALRFQEAVEHPKDITTHLPPGLIGNPAATPKLCIADELVLSGVNGANVAGCPPDSQIGVATVQLGAFGATYTGLFNMVPPPGVATELGFELFQVGILLKAYVRPDDSGIDILAEDTTSSLPLLGVDITVWGIPADPTHDRYRGGCLNTVYEGPNGEICHTTVPRKAFLRMPTSCSGAPLRFGADSNSYENPGTFAHIDFTGPTMSECARVPFEPGITVAPTGTAANSPTGVTVKVSLPQTQDPDGLQEADLKKAVVTLPEGMAINPSSADGLQACDDAHLHLGSNAPAECPDGSKLGTVTLHTQLIDHPIEGLIYLRPQASQDPMSGEMFRIALELRDDLRGLDFKIAGQIQANPVTGRLTTTFDENPQLPFEDISLHFKSGARAPLVTPASCKQQTTEADLYSWAQPQTAVLRSSTFDLLSGPDGTPCLSTWPFQPAFNAGVQSVQAGGYTPFLATFSRTDADQSMESVSVKMPPGLLGSLSGLPLCPEPQASLGTCSSDSQIGTMTAGAGAGPNPFYVTGGHVYMTGPYKGAPFGLSVVVPAKAGPFDLGNVVVRAKVEVDIHTAQLTVTTDRLPQVVEGVPVNLRLVNVTINRPNFTFNPTNCERMSVSGSMTGGQGAVAALSNGFQVTNCAALRFKPRFTVAASGNTSRSKGASLDAKLVYPKAPFGTQTNIAKVKVSLPKQLPSRLTTLQKACSAAVFDADPAGCPQASRIGMATAITPVLPVSLSGPVYFVSHGGQAFPDLVVVLQGDGVTVNLVGATFINKAAITSTTFEQVPDVLIGSFQLKLPQGRYSALAANGRLCGRRLRMPTAFQAQNGTMLHTSTPIAVTGCARHKHSARRAKTS